MPIAPNDDAAAIRSFIQAEVEKLRSAEFAADLLVLREALGDDALLAVPESEFIKHMQLIYAQLLGAWVTKIYGGGFENMMTDGLNWFRKVQYAQESIKVFQQEIDPTDHIVGAYSTAFSSTTQETGHALIEVMEKFLIGSCMGTNARSALDAHLAATYMSYYERVARICGIDPIQDSANRFDAIPPLSSSQRSSPASSGCLFILFIIVSGVAVSFSAAAAFAALL